MLRKQITSSVHFSLLWENPLTEGNFYLQGAFTYDNFNEESRLKYNAETHAYECTQLLKQGAYNYTYRLPVPPQEVPHRQRGISMKQRMNI